MVLGIFGMNVSSFRNSVIEFNNQYEQRIQIRTAFYDKMFRLIKNKTQIAVKNDESFREAVNVQMQGQKNGENLLMSWVTQSNPTATYEEVSKMYHELSDFIEGERNGFFENEVILSDIVRQHSNLIEKTPGSIYNLLLGYKKINYKPIQTSHTAEVMKTGIDDDIELELEDKK